MIALVALLGIAVEKNIECNRSGDSNVAMSGLKGLQEYTIFPPPVLDQILLLVSEFNNISFAHIFREH